MEWISIEDYLPQVEEEVLACDKWDVYVAKLDSYGYGGWQELTGTGAFIGISKVTHWMPLPELPSKE